MGIQKVIVAALAMSALSGCASIVHNGMREVSIASDPPGAKVSIYDRSNALVTTRTTPFVAQLEPKYGYFRGQSYRLLFEKEGFAPAEAKLTSTVSGWYFGNIVFGGLARRLVAKRADRFLHLLIGMLPRSNSLYARAARTFRAAASHRAICSR